LGLSAGRARQAALAAGYELYREGGAAYSVPTGTEIEVFRKVRARRMRAEHRWLPPFVTNFSDMRTERPAMSMHARPAALTQPRGLPGMHAS